MVRTTTAFVLAALLCVTALRADTPVRYRLSFPEPEHHWMQVEATFPGIGADPLDLRMSRASPGRYSLHDFAKNVYDVHVFGADGRELAATRPDPYGWRVSDHGGSVRLQYKVFGDRVDGTYLAIDPTHAHINMPAAIMFGRGLDERAVTIAFDPPAGRTAWRVASQLMPGATPLEFGAPNLQYLMDSPAEFGPVSIAQFTVDGHTFRFAAHHTGTSQDLDGFVGDVQKIVREERSIFGEFPAYEPGSYTFLADYLPYAHGDGMEHRNSTVITASSSIGSNRSALLETAAHEFFHNWNVERIRPQSLEPFDFERANMSSELWLAEGFTEYYAPLVLSRAGLMDVAATASELADFIASVTLKPAHLERSAEDMSRMASFTDGGRTIDQTNWAISYISYYQFGGAIALALDLTLRERADGATLDDFMRAMWQTHGKPGGSRPGYVDRPYTLKDAEARLAEVSGSTGFARDFFAKYIDGHDVADYAKLLEPAGFVVRRLRPGHPWIGTLTVEAVDGGLRLDSETVPGTPAYAAGLDLGDRLMSIDGRDVASESQLEAALQRRRPGDRVPIVVTDRAGTMRTATVTIGEDPQVEVAAIEQTGGHLSADQQAFRRRWLGSRQ